MHSSKMYIRLMCCEGRRDLQRVYTNRMYVPLIYWEGRGTSIEVETVRCTFLQCIRREGGDLHRVYTNRMHVPLIYWEGRGDLHNIDRDTKMYVPSMCWEGGGDLHRVGDGALQQDVCSGLLRSTVECKMQFTDFAL